MLYAAIHWSGVQISLPRSFYRLVRAGPAVYRRGGEQAGIFGLVVLKEANTLSTAQCVDSVHTWQTTTAQP